MSRLAILKGMLPSVEYYINAKSSGQDSSSILDLRTESGNEQSPEDSTTGEIFEYLESLSLDELKDLRRRLCTTGLQAISRTIQEIRN